VFKISFIFFYFFFISHNLLGSDIGKETGFKIPRYVSLKSNEVNLRVGPSENYPILLSYTSINLPIEIMEENGYWRKIKDHDGNTGWIKKNLLKGTRYALILKKNDFQLIFSKPEGEKIGEIGQFNIVKIITCLDLWCSIDIEGYTGWIKKHNLWGVYNEEKINIPIYQPIINLIWKLL